MHILYINIKYNDKYNVYTPFIRAMYNDLSPILD